MDDFSAVFRLGLEYFSGQIRSAELLRHRNRPHKIFIHYDSRSPILKTPSTLFAKINKISVHKFKSAKSDIFKRKDLNGGASVRGNDIGVSPGMTVR